MNDSGALDAKSLKRECLNKAFRNAYVKSSRTSWQGFKWELCVKTYAMPSMSSVTNASFLNSGSGRGVSWFRAYRLHVKYARKVCKASFARLERPKKSAMTQSWMQL